MHRLIRFLFVLLSLPALYGFSSERQTAANAIIILDRNGQPVSNLTDGNNIRLRVTLPQAAAQTETITFLLDDDTPVGSCVAASGESTCESDLFPALGWYWDANGNGHTKREIYAKNGNGLAIGGPVSVGVSPRPVVMVHGFISTWDAWNSYLGPQGFLAPLGLAGYAVGDGQVPGVMDTGSLIDPPGRTNTIGQNAAILGEYINGVKQKTGAEMVDLVVHSMGGMISRYYIDRVMQERDVAQLIMLGSPMGGSDCAVLPAALGFYLPASIEIRESYMKGVFNEQITHRHGIEFYDLGGTAINEAFKSPCSDIPNDTVVSFSSINSILLQSSQMDVLHNDMPMSEATFQNYVKPLLQKTADTFSFSPDPAPLATPRSPIQFTRVYTGHVEAGGSDTLTINVDADVSVAGFALYDPSRSVETVVRGASGNVIQLDPQANGFIQIDDPSSLLYLGYGFANPKPGPWNVTVQATEATPPSGTDFSISVYFIGGATLETQSSTLVPRPNEAVQFTANLLLGGQPLDITSAAAVILDQDGNVETLTFPAGKQVITSWTPSRPGIYAVDIIVAGFAPDGSTIERTDFLAIEVQTNPGNIQIGLNLFLLIAIALVVLLGLVVLVFSIFKFLRRPQK